MAPRTDLLAWLLDSDPAIRWQVECDLLNEAPTVWAATRASIATKGFGARLLSLQDRDGQWAGGAFFPAEFDFAGPEAAEQSSQPWTATTWTLNSLREWGLDAGVLRERRTAELLAENCRWEYEGRPYWDGEVDCCINAWTVANGVWLDVCVDELANWFVRHQLPDGGGTASGPKVRRDRRFIRRSIHSKGFSRTRSRPGERMRRARLGDPVRSTCCSAVCSGDSRPANRWGPGSAGLRTRSGGVTTCSTQPTTSAKRRCRMEMSLIREWRTRSR